MRDYRHNPLATLVSLPFEAWDRTFCRWTNGALCPWRLVNYYGQRRVPTAVARFMGWLTDRSWFWRPIDRPKTVAGRVEQRKAQKNNDAESDGA